MPAKTDFNLSPYFDDFSESKKFHRILFRPAFAVQARELTQSQSILQNQVEKMGNHIFEDGAQMIPGEVTYDLRYYSIKLTSFAGTTNLSDFIGLELTGQTSQVVAKVIKVDVATSTDPNTLYVKYTKTGVGNATTDFVATETLAATHPTLGIITAVCENSFTGSAASIVAGTYYINGFAVNVAEQSIVLDKYENTPSYRVGLLVTESFVTPNQDPSLVDNAAGSSNANAPGAHRFKIDLTLTKLALTSVEDDNFIELLRLSKGNLQSRVRTTEYAILEDTLARRTFDESGNYAIRQFDLDVREHLINGDNRGIFTAAEGGLESKLALGLSPGKAYVRGYEVDKIGTEFVAVDKPRTFGTENGFNTLFDVGNFVNVSNVYGSPDVNFVTGKVETFKKVELRIASPSYVPGNINANVQNCIYEIGRAKTKGFEFNNTIGIPITSAGHIAPSASQVMKHFLFDVEMFSHIGITDAVSFTTGETITGSTSGATGIVESISSSTSSYAITSSTAANPVVITTAADTDIKDGDAIKITGVATQTELNDNVFYVKADTSGTAKRDFILVNADGTEVDGSAHTGAGSGGALSMGKVVVSSVNGEFQAGETITGSSSSNTATIKANVFGNKGFTSHSINDTKEITMAGSPTYTAQTDLTSSFGENVQLSGNISISGGSALVVGFNTKFNEELKIGDSVEFADTGGTIITKTVLQIHTSSSITLDSAIGATAVSNSIIIRRRAKLQEPNKNISIFSLPYDTIKTLKTNANSGISDTSYTVRKTFVGTLSSTGDITITANTGETFVAQSERDYSVTIMTAGGASSSGAVGNKLSTTGNQHEGDACFTLGGSPVGRSLTLDFGANHQGHEVKIIATLTKSAQNEKSKTLQSNETVTIATQSDAESKVIGLGKADVYQLVSVKMSADFSTAPTSGDTDITERFNLDTGQRDNFYDIGRLVRKQGELAPTGQLLITFNYFTHGNGDFFSVDSYVSINYEDIPTYTSDTSGDTFELRDTLDFRPRVDDASTINAGQQNRSYDGTGASAVDVVKFGTNVLTDHEYYLGRIDKLYITKEGEFKTLQGAPDTRPQEPGQLENAMHLYTINFPAYVLNPEDVNFETVDNRRYTMRDIGEINKKIDRVEYYTQLSLLETAAQALQIQDSNGFDRFKNGFIVDNFDGHGIGEVTNGSHRCSIDYRKKIMRPLFKQDAVELEEIDEDGTTLLAADRTAANYQRTGEVLTLPYTNVDLINQPFASKAINVNPFAIFSWVGTIELTPSSDEWRETERAPDLVVNSDTGAWDQLLREGRVPNQNEIALGTVWNDWQTNWTGAPLTSAVTATGGRFMRGRAIMQRTTITSINQVNQSRTGITTTAVPQTIRTSMGDRVVDTAFVPFIRSRNVDFVATRLKPNTRVYPFFDNVDITAYITPSGGSLGGNLVTDANGAVSGTFAIPDPKVNSNPRWRTGERTFRLTSSSTNSQDAAAVETAANAEYVARGLLNTVRDTIVSTREFRGVQNTVTETRQTLETSTRAGSRVVGWADPLAQTIMVDDEGGVFLTSIDLYFSTKDANIPITVQLRNTVNGYPGSKILPFGEVSLNPSSVNTSSDASVKTTFTFPAPVYIQDKTEYCFVILSNSNEYNCYVGRLGETNIGSNRTISQQPYAGVMFKSQNGSTWTTEQNEDIKFTIKRAEFEAVTGTVHLANKELPARTLKQNPLRTTNNSKVIRVFHPNHNLHDTNSVVTIAGVPNGTHNGLAHTDINGTYTQISNITLDSFDITSPSSTNANTTGDIGGTAITSTQNRQIDVLNIAGIQTLAVPGCNINAFVRTTTSKSVHGTQTPYSLTTNSNKIPVSLQDDIYFTAPQAVMSQPNETTRMNGQKSFFTIFELSSTNTKLSPVIDLARNSVFCIANRLNSPDSGNTPDFVADTAPADNSTASNYITKPVVLTNNSTALDIRLTQVVRSSSEVEVYFRTTSADEVRDIHELDFVPFNTDGRPDATVPASETDEDFREYKYSVAGLNAFSAFQIKIVLKGTNSSYPPILRDMRGIALAI
tara:strand:- start:16172 stop:22282 length:6111 start_codon:yes stop_codon:yes gene_type:complete